MLINAKLQFSLLSLEHMPTQKMNKSNNSILEAEIGLPCHSHLFNEGGG